MNARLTEILRAIGGQRVTDVLIDGIVDVSRKPYEFRPTHRLVRVVLESRSLWLQAVGDSVTMFVALDGEFPRDPPGEDDDTVVRSFGSISYSVMGPLDVIHYAVLGAVFWNPTEGVGGVECSAIELLLSHDRSIVFDATHHFGIRVGGEISEWMRNQRSVGSGVLVRDARRADGVPGS